MKKALSVVFGMMVMASFASNAFAGNNGCPELEEVKEKNFHCLTPKKAPDGSFTWSNFSRPWKGTIGGIQYEWKPPVFTYHESELNSNCKKIAVGIAETCGLNSVGDHIKTMITNMEKTGHYGLAKQ